MIRKISMFILMALFVLSGSVMVFAKTVSNPFLALEYEIEDDWQIYGTYVDEGYGYFEYTDSEWNETVTVSANNLETVDKVTDEEIEALKNGEVSEEMIAKWFSIDVSQIERAVVNDKNVFVCSIYLNDMDRMYYVYYDGPCEYQFSMPAKDLSEAQVLTKVFESAEFLGYKNMLEIDYDLETIHLAQMGGYIDVPKYFTYFWSTMDADHHNFYRANGEYNSLIQWFYEQETYFYMISDRLYDEIHFYKSSTFNKIDFTTASDEQIMKALATIKSDLEAEGHTVEIIGDGIHETAFTKFIALQIHDVSGYDSKFYYTMLDKEAYAFEYYYYEGEQDQEFLDSFVPIVNSFSMSSDNNILSGFSVPDVLKVTEEGSKETFKVFAMVAAATILILILSGIGVFKNLSKKNKNRDNNDWYDNSGNGQFGNNMQNINEDAWGNSNEGTQEANSIFTETDDERNEF